MTNRLLWLLVIGALICAAVYFYAPSQNHRVYFNGTVLTLDSENTVAEAIAIRNGLIEAVGTNRNAEEWTTPDTELINLEGKTLVPGFIDAHSHFPVSGLFAVTADLRPPPLGNVSRIANLLDAIQRYDSDNDRKWVIGFGYDDSSIQEQRHPTREELDSVISDKPVYLWHSSGHMGVANTKALEALGIGDRTPNPLGGVIVRDQHTSRPNGLLLETAAPPMSRLLRTFGWSDYYHMLKHAVNSYRAAGITTAQNGGADTQLMRALYWAQKLRLIPFRLNLYAKESTLGREILNDNLDPDDFNSRQFQINTIKLFADGSPQGHTAWLTQPYHRQQTGRDKSYRGFPTHTREQLYQKALPFHQRGWQLALHGNGDAAIDDIIAVCQRLTRTHPRDNQRTVLVHAQMTRSDQLPAMRDCGITPSFFSNHTRYWGDAHRETHLGPERAAGISPASSANRLGLRFTIHTDTPVTPINPLHSMASAVERETLSGVQIGPNERISRLQALRAVTTEAAWQMFSEHTRGSIEPGKIADFAVLSHNPLDESINLREIEVHQTSVNGIEIYSR